MKIVLLLTLLSAVLGTFPGRVPGRKKAPLINNGWAPGFNKKVPLIGQDILSRKHLTLGSTDPPTVPGKTRIYIMRFCPYSHRVVLTLLSKGIPFDPVFINLKTKPEWYTQKVSGGKVPSLSVNGSVVTESLVIADYLDEQYPIPSLHSCIPLQKAKDRLLVENFSKVVGAFYPLMGGTNTTLAQFETVLTELDHFEKELVSRKTPYFGGKNKAALPDYMIWPWFERIALAKVLYGDQYVISKERFPTLTKWIDRLKQDEAVKAWYVSPENHAKFIKSNIAGTPDYDLLTK